MYEKNNSLRDRRRIATLYGDADLLLSIYYSEFWKNFFTGNKLGWWILLREFGKLAREMTVFPVRVFLRYKPGNRTAGWILFLLSTSLLLAYNSQHLPSLLAPLCSLFIWTVPFISDVGTLDNLVFDEIRSVPMLAFSSGYFIWGLTQVSGVYMGWHNKDDRTKRGESLLYLLARRIPSMSEYMIQTWVEPSLVIGIAAIFWWGFSDATAGFYFASAGLCLFFQELLDAMSRKVMPT